MKTGFKKVYDKNSDIPFSIEDPIILVAYKVDNIEFTEVLECCVLAGVHDYSLRVVVADLQAFESFLKDKLANVKQVENIESTMILNQTLSRLSLNLGI